MAGLSRREFLAATGGLALLWGLPRGQLGSALAAPARPADVPTTLLETIRQRTVGSLSYRTLAAAPGEPYIPRYDLLGRAADPARTRNRRSIVYLGHMTDIHVMDPQSPARLEPLWAVSSSTFAGTIRPQDALTVHVQAQMVAAMRAARYSPLSGAPMAAVFNTGDSADQHSMLELRWYIDTMDGQQVIPDSGKPGEYEGPQVWPEATYAWHPEDPGSDPFGQYGFPRVPGMLTAAVSEPVDSGGLPVPWYAVYGNHDTLYYGAFPIDASLRSLATGQRKPALYQALAGSYFDGMASDSTVLGRLGHTLRTQLGMQSGIRTVTADPNRKLFEQREFVAEHFSTQPLPGPVGHGFTQANLDNGTGYWAADIGPHLRLFGLDTCNQVLGADGAVPQDQFEWLKAGLAEAGEQQKLAIVISHHNSKTLENDAVPAVGSEQRLVHRRVRRHAAGASEPDRVGERPHAHQHDRRPSPAGRGRGLLGDHDRLLYRLPATAATARGGRQPRRHHLHLRDDAGPCQPGGVALRGLQPARIGVAEPGARLERLDRQPADAARLAPGPQRRVAAAGPLRHVGDQRPVAGGRDDGAPGELAAHEREAGS